LARAAGGDGNLGTSLLIDPEAGVMGFESFWASDGALVASEDVVAASYREAPGGQGELSPAHAQ
jgi:hypothetical protein